MTNEDLANELRALLTEVHARIDALPAGALRTRLQRRAFIAHAALEDLHADVVSAGQVQPFSGGDPKPPAP